MLYCGRPHVGPLVGGVFLLELWAEESWHLGPGLGNKKVVIVGSGGLLRWNYVLRLSLGKSDTLRPRLLALDIAVLDELLVYG